MNVCGTCKYYNEWKNGLCSNLMAMVEPEDYVCVRYEAYKPRITQFSIDVVDKNVDMDKITKILRDNGIEVLGVSNDTGWEWDEYMK